MGYLNRFIDLGFPELAGVDGQNRAICWVKIRNPRLIPSQDLITSGTRVQLDADGKPVNTEVAAAETYGTFAKLVVAGNVWDATWVPPMDDAGQEDPDAEPPLIPIPPTPEDMGKMPIMILNAIGEEMRKANPH